MWKNYFISAWRNLVKNRLSSFINIAGLAVGLATAILIFLWIDDTLQYDRFHVNYDRIHLLMKTQRGSGGEISTGSSVPGQLADAVRSAIPEVQYAARGVFEEPLLNYKDKALYQDALYTDPEFFRFMTFPAVQGNPALALQDASSVVMTETAARRLFGDENPLGKNISFNSVQQLKVGAVIRDVPEHSSYRFDIVLPFAFYEKSNGNWLRKWDDNRILTWVALKPQTRLAPLNGRLTQLLRQKTGDDRLELFAYSLKDSWLNNSFKNGRPAGGRSMVLKLMGVLGLFVLFIACINFMNLVTARSEKRSREVGVRKTLGASRRQLIFQFLTEAFLLTFFALFLGVLLARLLLPSFNRLANVHTGFDLSSGRIWLSLMVIGFLTALLAGSYPAFVLSRFRPVLVLKGLFTHRRGGSLLRRTLVTFQFVITIFLVICTIVIIRQERHVENRPIGYDPENLVDIQARGDMGGKYALVKNELAKIPGVVSTSAGNDDLVRFGGGTDDLQWPGKTADQDFYVKISTVQYDWVKTAGLSLVEGRDFSPDFGSDSSACLVNQAAVRKMGLKEPVVGTRLGKNTIVGVVHDFIFNDAFNNPEPLVLYLGTGGMSHFFVRIRNNDQWRQTLAQVETAVKKINPGYPFDYRFTAESYQRQFEGIKSTAQTLDWVGALAILISCLGLFGLSVFVAERRAREIGIRKILGAGVSRIWFSLSADFMKPVCWAFVIATPLAALAMNALLQHFDYHIRLAWWIFALGGLLAFVIALATVSYQGLRSALSNPAESLRTE